MGKSLEKRARVQKRRGTKNNVTRRLLGWRFAADSTTLQCRSLIRYTCLLKRDLTDVKDHKILWCVGMLVLVGRSCYV